MSEKRCYYDCLGVPKDAPKADIRKAYKKAALKYHPDRNSGSAEAEAKFKEVTEAYSVLSDDEKRPRYDQFGHAGIEGQPGFAGGDIFSHFQDIFSDFFGGFGGHTRRGGPQRGRDARIQQRLTLEEAVLGSKKDIRLTTPAACDTCKGSGSKPGSSPARCGTCDGAGQVSTGRGFIMFTQPCPACHGEGQVITTPCNSCSGAGFVEKERTVTVSFPAGIDTGHRLRVAGQGMPGPGGGPAGHLYVDVILEPHERFERDGIDLITRKTISFADAALGTVVAIEMLDGSTVELRLGAGTQPGEVISKRGQGAPNVEGRGRGALHLVVQVDVPKRLSRRAKKLLRELAEELGPISQRQARAG